MFTVTKEPHSYGSSDGSQESTTLLSSAHTTNDQNNNNNTRTRNSSNGGGGGGGGMLMNRLGIIVSLAALTAVSLYYHGVTNDLSLQLQADETAIHRLQKTVDENQEVIERFNSSVTNQDVTERLSRLERDLDRTSNKLQHELEGVQEDVSEQLNVTLDRLSETVDRAEEEISKEVEKVKKDVEQYVLTTQDQFSMENSFMVYQLAGTFTLLSCLISMWHMTAHLRRMNQPDAQRRILSILWMSPIYAVTSWFSLVFHSAQGYLAIIKDGYEAYIIYQFLGFCIAVLGKGDRNTVVDLLARHADHLTPPFRLFGFCEIFGCCKPEPYEDNRALASAILLQCQLFAMQFVFFRPLTTTAMVVLEHLQYYGAGDGPTDYRAPQFYIAIVQNVSIFVAFTGLLKFYHAVDKDLAWCRPFAKFLCIKGVVFMTFWQGLAISLLAQTTDIGAASDNGADEWAKSAQNFLICLEMLLFSIAHFYCFPTDEWEDGYRVKHSQGHFGDSIALGDFFSDLKLILKSNGHKKKKKQQHATVLEGDDEDDDTDGMSTTTSEHADDEKYVAKALGKAMGDSGTDDPDIAAIRKRLLRSELLRSAGDISTGDIGLDPSFDGDIEHGGHKNDSESQGRNWSGYSIGGSEKGSPESHQRSAPTSEATALLTSPDDGGSSFLEALLPTIFMAEIEKQKQHTESMGTIGSDQASTFEKHDDQVESDDSPPTPEKTPLFAPSDGGSSFVESLRPSIFTTIASMAEQEENVEDETDRAEVASIDEQEDNKDETDRAGAASIAEDEDDKDETDRAGVTSANEDDTDRAGVTSTDKDSNEDETDRIGVASIAEDEENKEGEGDHADDQDLVKEDDWCMGGQAGGKNHAY